MWLLSKLLKYMLNMRKFWILMLGVSAWEKEEKM
jgi:hypothetical protein